MILRIYLQTFHYRKPSIKYWKNYLHQKHHLTVAQKELTKTLNFPTKKVISFSIIFITTKFVGLRWDLPFGPILINTFMSNFKGKWVINTYDCDNTPLCWNTLSFIVY